MAVAGGVGAGNFAMLAEQPMPRTAAGAFKHDRAHQFGSRLLLMKEVYR
jgi:hypothetical protein